MKKSNENHLNKNYVYQSECVLEKRKKPLQWQTEKVIYHILVQMEMNSHPKTPVKINPFLEKNFRSTKTDKILAGIRLRNVKLFSGQTG